MKETTKNGRKIGGISTPGFVIPIAVVLAFLHVCIIVSIFKINSASEELSEMMSSYGGYINEAGNMQAGSSFLSETSLSFLLHPTLQTEEGETLNVGPLVGYATEYVNERRGDDEIAKFSTYGVNSSAVEAIRKAAVGANDMNAIQAHAIALVRAVYPFPPNPALNGLPTYQLSEEELALSNEDKLAASFNLIAGVEYSEAKKVVSENITECTRLLQAEMQEKSSVQMKVVELARRFLWGMTLSVVGVLIFIFIFVIHQLVAPLRGFVRGIDSGDVIEEDKGLHEVRLLANSYNELLEKKNSLENFLRAAAETDSLTDLPNRFYFEQYMESSGESGYSVVLLLFDVNYLKLTNDTKGHLAGDALLKRAADCIRDCFGSLPDSKCFRYGGDEFAAIVKNCSMRDILRIINEFNEKQKECDVSIATGYAYAKDIGTTNYHALFAQADREMYVQKSIIHKLDEQNR